MELEVDVVCSFKTFGFLTSVNVPSIYNINSPPSMNMTRIPCCFRWVLSFADRALFIVQLGGREDSIRPVKQGFAAWSRWTGIHELSQGDSKFTIYIYILYIYVQDILRCNERYVVSINWLMIDLCCVKKYPVARLYGSSVLSRPRRVPSSLDVAEAPRVVGGGSAPESIGIVG